MNKMEILGGTLAGMMFLSGCKNVDTKTPEPTPIVASGEALPTATVEATPTTSATATDKAPTPIPTKAEFSVDTVKLNTTPKSYEDLTANLGNYVESPDPLKDVNAFMDWWKNQLIPALGDETKLKRNINTDAAFLNDGLLYLAAGTGKEEPLQGQSKFYYFRHENTVYPVLVLSTGDDTWGNKTVSVILTEGEWGWDSLKNLVDGKKVVSIILYPDINSKFIPDNCKPFAEAGLDGSVYDNNWRVPAAGIVQTKP